MAYALPATVVIMTFVLLVVTASTVVLSISWPSAVSSSTPVSSMNALRVPEPSSREITVMAADGSNPSLSAGRPPHPIMTAASTAHSARQIQLRFFCFMVFSAPFLFLFRIQLIAPSSSRHLAPGKFP